MIAVDRRDRLSAGHGGRAVRQNDLLDRTRFFGHGLQPENGLADRHARVYLAFEPANDRNVTLGIEPVAALGSLWAAHVVAPLPGPQRAGADAGGLDNGLDVVER